MPGRNPRYINQNKMSKYKVFTRTWWRNNSNYPNGLEPSPGRKTIIAIALSEEQARDICKRYNDSHSPGRLSRKAEYTEI